MDDRELEDDLAHQPTRRGERRMVARSDELRRFVPVDQGRSPRDERIEDALRPAEVGAARRAAAEAQAGPGGERPRRRFRLLAHPYLDRAAAEQQAELEVCRAKLEWPRRGFEFEILTNPSPDERRRSHDRWAAAEERLRDLRVQRSLAAVTAARAAGAASLADFLATLHPVPSDPLCAAYEAGAIAPLDDAIERASRDRRSRSPLPLTHPEHAADSPVAEALVAYAERFPAAGVPTVLRVMGRALGCDPDLAGSPGVIRDAEACVGARPWITRGRAYVLIGALDGPGTLLEALAAFGRMARRAFVAGTRRAAGAVAADPAFDVAAGVLFGRLMLSPTFRARFGPRPEEGLDADLRLELALPPRLGWTYLYIALQGRGSEGDPPTAESGRALRRALGRPAAVDQLLVPFRCDPQGAAQLRGTVLALLLEERLLSRWGREWFSAGRAGRFLRECWEAEEEQTAESVANVLDLGTIEPTPILDGCRP